MSELCTNKLVFIINPISGVVQKNQLPKMIENVAQKYGCSVEIFYSQYAKHLTVLVRELLEKSYEQIIVVGGDGTINEAISPLLDYPHARLGIIPMGSGNGLARHLGISLNPQLALEQVFQSKKNILIDVGQLNNHYFISVAGVGNDAWITKLYEETKMRGLKAYISCTLKAFWKNESFILESANQKWHTRQMSISNCSQYGYGFLAAPQADLEDGILNINILRKKARWAIGLLGIELLFKKTKSSFISDRFEAAEINFRTDKAVPYQVDGEYLGMDHTFKIKVLARALRLMI